MEIRWSSMRIGFFSGILGIGNAVGSNSSPASSASFFAASCSLDLRSATILAFFYSSVSGGILSK
jgi:hypothetical protein